MSDIHAATSTYESGTNDTYTAVADNDDDVLAAHQNGPASAIVQIETILGAGTTLKGSLADLAARLAVPLAASGKLNDFSATTKTTWPIPVAECGTGTVSMTDEQVVRYQATGDKLESTGYTLPASTGVIATLDDTQTLTAKTLTTPTIASFVNAAHDHSNAAGGGDVALKVAIISHEETSGTNGGASSATTWNTRDMNTEVDSDTLVTLASSQFTITSAGTYLLEGWAVGHQVNSHRLRIRNISDTTTEAEGVNVIASATDGSNCTANIHAVVTIAGSKTFELQHYTQAADTFGLGVAMTLGTNEVFASLRIMKIG